MLIKAVAGGGGKGGGGSARVAQEAPDSLRSKAYARVVDLVCEGEIEGLNHPKRMFDLTEGLVRRGYSDANVELILGGKFRRALAEVWGPAGG